ncbi:MAG TPA: POTRA domain-containing protein [Anaeromyxobacteraceae bacterium]|nr:POTRA domain-containing protein [Anaeromyxobacteraceae bacterium]
MWSKALLVVLAFLGAAVAVSAAPDSPALGPRSTVWPRLSAIELDLPAGQDPAALKDAVTVKPGEPLSPRGIRRTVERLFLLGHFANVIALTRPAEDGNGGVVLSLRCVQTRVLASLRIASRPSPPAIEEERLRREVQLSPGDELWPGRLEEAAERVRAAYFRRGFRHAAVKAIARGEPRAEVELSVEEGIPTLVTSVALLAREQKVEPGEVHERIEAIDGKKGLARLARGLATREGTPLDLDALEGDLRALRTELHRLGRLRERIGVPTIALEGQGARVEIPVDVGPRVDFHFPGATVFGPAELRAELGLEAEQPLDAPAMEAAAARLRAFYLAHGYAETRVTVSEVAGARVIAVVFAVEEGRRYRVRRIDFPGARERSQGYLAARLREGLQLGALPEKGAEDDEAERLARASGLPVRVHSRLPPDPAEVWTPTSFEKAAQHLVELYRSDGYLDATCEGMGVTLDARAGTADVEIRLREGVRTRVLSISFEGNSIIPGEELTREARIVSGEPLAYEKVEATRAALLGLYSRRGYLYARVADAEEFYGGRSQVAVRFKIDEGPLVRLGRVVVSGARRTRDDLVRETLALRAGDVYGVDAAARSQSALLRLGVFRSVGLSLADPDRPEPTKDLTVEVAERPWRSIAPGIGFSLANGPRAFVEFLQPNLFGRALELSVRGKVNYPIAALRSDRETLEEKRPIDRVEGRLEAGLHDPRVKMLGLSMGARVDAVLEREHRLAYDLTRGSTVFGIDFPWRGHLTLSLQYELEVDHIVKAPEQNLILTFADVQQLRLGEGVTTLQSFRPVLALDYRDNSVHPRRGWLFSVSADYARSIGANPDGAKGSPLLFGLVPGSDVFTDMVKLTGILSGYLPVGSRSVLALSLRAGRVVPLDPQSVTIGPKRFFLGGAASMRGYGEDAMIPEDLRGQILSQVRACASSPSRLACSDAAKQLAAGQTLISVGGEAFLLGKAEFRFPLHDTVELGFFADYGNLWSDPDETSFLDLRLNLGFGLRVLTPIGPAVLDVGFNVSPDERLGESYAAPHFSIGLF